MIKYTLRCDRDHEFEGWFKDSATFEKQQSIHAIECPVCGSVVVERGLSAPNISTTRSKTAAAEEQATKIRLALKELRSQVEANSENVGDRFAEEARKIHYGETEARGIHGNATQEEAQELAEEGIDFTVLPWIEDEVEN